MNPLHKQLRAPTVAAGVLIASLQLDDASSFFVSALSAVRLQNRATGHQRRSSRLVLSSTVFENKVSSGGGVVTDPANGLKYDMDFIASALLEPPPQALRQPPMSHSPIAEAATSDWPATMAPIYNEWHDHVEHEVVSREDTNIHPVATTSANNQISHNGFRSNRPLRSVISGRERRAGWDSYAPARGAPLRQGSTGGVVGNPGGEEDWYYTSSYGPATTVPSVSAGSVIGQLGAAKPVVPSTKAANLSTNNVAQEVSKKSTIITGRERRASFDSFNSFAPAHETPTIPASNHLIGASQNEAESVVATLSALPASSNNEALAAIEEETPAEDASAAVPLDTPARQSLPPNLSLRLMPGKGLGVVANQPIANGEFVGEYEGEVMSEEVKDRRYLSSLRDKLTDEDREWIQSRLDRGQSLTGCYLYGVSLPHDKGRIYVDAEDEHESLWTRFLNHASPPLNNVNPKSIHESWDGNPRVWFLANRDIAEGEEICFDYGDDYWLEGDAVV